MNTITRCTKNRQQASLQLPRVVYFLWVIGQPGKPWSAIENREIVLTTIDLFGVDRCMFASNFPVDSLCGSFAEIIGGFAQIIADFSFQERDALFARNAMRIYNIADENMNHP